MKIIDGFGLKIQACFVMQSYGYEISISTIMNANRAEIAVFKDDQFINNFNDMQSAINWTQKEGNKICK